MRNVRPLPRHYSSLSGFPDSKGQLSSIRFNQSDKLIARPFFRRLRRDRARKSVRAPSVTLFLSLSPPPQPVLQVATAAAATTVKGMETIILQRARERGERAAGDINGCLVKALTSGRR